MGKPPMPPPEPTNPPDIMPPPLTDPDLPPAGDPPADAPGDLPPPPLHDPSEDGLRFSKQGSNNPAQDDRGILDHQADAQEKPRQAQ